MPVFRILAVLVLVVGAGLAYYTFSAEAEKVPEAQQQAVSETAGAPVKAWKIRCNKAEEGVEATIERGRCEVFQKLSVQETGQRFAEFAIGFPKDEENARGIMILPLGILLEKGVEMKIDDQQSFKFTVRYCDNGGCVAFLSLSEPVLDMLKRGSKAEVSLQNSNGQGISFGMPLTGFAEAFEKVS